MLPRLHIFLSAFTHSDQVFLSLPLPLALRIALLVMELLKDNPSEIVFDFIFLLGVAFYID